MRPILRVQTAKVAKVGSTWTLYVVKFSDGREGTTFSKSVYEAAQRAAKQGYEVDATFHGKNLVTLDSLYSSSRTPE